MAQENNNQVAQQNDDHKIDEAALEELVAATDTGARHPDGAVGKLLIWTAFAWSAFQLWIASPLPYIFSDIIPLGNNTDNRSIHLAFAMFLAFLAYPALKRSPRDRIPLQDWLMGIAAICVTMYLSVFDESLAMLSLIHI